MRTAVVDYLREQNIITTITKLTNDNEAHHHQQTTFTWATHSGIKKARQQSGHATAQKKAKRKVAVGLHQGCVSSS
jgi:hypothetical protein|tara:strand:+ start:135 stop:362 length:228 start_codon:yes stop_codon:yes gene_type:complete